MTTSQIYNIDYTNVITLLVLEKPNQYSNEIRKNSKISEWLTALYPFTTHIPEQVYAVLHPNDSAFCKSGNKRKFRNINVGWNRCNDKQCNDCITRSVLKSKQTCLQRYGVDNPMKAELIKKKPKDTMINKYGGYGIASNKRKQHYLEKYGVDHFWKTDIGQLSRKESLLSKYGVDNPSKSQIIQDCKKQSYLEKYGVSHPMQVSEIKNKCISTWMEKYNVSNPSKLPKIRDKAVATMISRYGENFRYMFTKQAQQTCIVKYGNAIPARIQHVKDKSAITKQCSFFENLNNRNYNTSIPEFNVSNYNGVKSVYSWKCSACNLSFTSNLNNGKIPKCSHCFPQLGTSGVSAGESELANYIKSLGVVLTANSRSIIGPKEIDIYIPSHKIAVEYNGVYHHSEISGNKNKSYHLEKTNKCKEQGITLMHIYDYEWNTKQDLVKSRIAQKIGISSRIYARKCTLSTISSNQASKFLNENHMQGPCNSSINFGLFFNNKLVSVMTFGKSRYNKIAQYELLRFCSIINTTVVGGASKLLKHFEKQYNTPSIVSYCDLRLNTGNVYSTLGFSLHSQSSPNYKYHKNCTNLQSRIKFQKHKLAEKLELFDKDKSEWENMKDNGYDRIWDCGNLVFLKNTNI